MAEGPRVVPKPETMPDEGFASLIQHVSLGIYRSTPEGRIYFANPALLRMLGTTSVAELNHLNFDGDVYSPEFRRARFMRDIERHGQAAGLEFGLKRADGQRIWVRESARAVRDESGTTVYYEGTLEDVTERHDALRALRESENRLRDIVEHSTNLFYAHTADHVLTYLSPQTRQFFDCEPGEALVRWTEFATDNPINQIGFGHTLRAIETGERGPPYELELKGRLGRLIRVEVNEAPVVRDGRTIAMVGSLTDITERRRARDELQSALSLLTATLESTADGIVAVDIEGRMTTRNRRFVSMWRLPPELAESTDPDGAQAFVMDQLMDPAGFRAKVEELRRQPDAESFDVLTLKDGRVFERYSLPQRVEGQIVGRVYSFRDVTKRRRAEEALRSHTEQIHGLNEALEERVRGRTRELEVANRELEAFSSSVSHDLRAPLRTIDGFSQALAEDYSGTLDANGKYLVDRIQSGTRKMAQLIDDLLALSRVTRSELQRGPVDLSEIVESLLQQQRRRQPGRDVQTVVQPGVTAQADARLIRIVLENLVSNAWKFTGKRPVARIEFGTSQVGGAPAFYLRDNGAGFDMRYASQLFKPFERLHPMADFEGTGIGLATVQRIIERHGGRVWAEGVPEAGATVSFTLPEPPA